MNCFKIYLKYLFTFRDKKEAIGTIIGALCFAPSFICVMILAGIRHPFIGFAILFFTQCMWLNSITLCTWSIDVDNKRLKEITRKSIILDEVFYVIYVEDNEKEPTYLMLTPKNGIILQSNLYDASKYTKFGDALLELYKAKEVFKNLEFSIIPMDKRIFGNSPRWVK